MAGPATDARRALGKLALLLAGVWALLFVGTIVIAAQGNVDRPAVALPLLLVPGLAFGPAAYYAIRLHRVDDPAASKALLGRTWLFAGIGFVLGIAVIVIINRVNGG